MRSLAQKAVEMVKAQGGRIVNHDLLDATLREIGKGYRPGLIGWIKGNPDRWRRLLDLEDGINKAALGGDQVGFTAALSEYQDFFREMVAAYEMKNTFPLFEGRANG